MTESKEWEKALRFNEQENRANPKHPYNAHFYEARRGAELRIFDLHCSENGYITIGECLPPDRAPLKPPVVPGSDFGIYAHVNYGGVRPQSPEDVISAFAAEHGLTQVRKFAEIHTAGEMSRLVPETLRRLKILQSLIQRKRYPSRNPCLKRVQVRLRWLPDRRRQPLQTIDKKL